MRASVEADQCIDAKKIFITGFSMGGYFTHNVGVPARQLAGARGRPALGRHVRRRLPRRAAADLHHARRCRHVHRLHACGKGARDMWLKRNKCGTEFETKMVDRRQLRLVQGLRSERSDRVLQLQRCRSRLGGRRHERGLGLLQDVSLRRARAGRCTAPRARRMLRSAHESTTAVRGLGFARGGVARAVVGSGVAATRAERAHGAGGEPDTESDTESDHRVRHRVRARHRARHRARPARPRRRARRPRRNRSRASASPSRANRATRTHRPSKRAFATSMPTNRSRRACCARCAVLEPYVKSMRAGRASSTAATTRR